MKHHKDGEIHGLATEWYENGQKTSELIAKDGEIHGLEGQSGTRMGRRLVKLTTRMAKSMD